MGCKPNGKQILAAGSSVMGSIMTWTWDTSLGVDRCNEEIAQCFGNGDPVALKLDATMSSSQSQAGHGCHRDGVEGGCKTMTGNPVHCRCEGTPDPAEAQKTRQANAIWANLAVRLQHSDQPRGATHRSVPRYWDAMINRQSAGLSLLGTFNILRDCGRARGLGLSTGIVLLAPSHAHKLKSHSLVMCKTVPMPSAE